MESGNDIPGVEFDDENTRDSSTEASLGKSLDDEPFYFESDSLALRNNPDYSCLLKTLILLEGQRVKASEDLETLIELKESALKNPTKFVSLLNKHNMDNNEFLSKFPSRQKVYIVPEIDWDKYYECVDLGDLETIKNQNMKRVQSLRQANKMIQESGQATRSSSRNKQTTSGNKEKPIHNYNKSWSVEEQRKLEELLIEFPPEDNEAGRFRKIADKLGTRTSLQVQSHCQKYFIKLAKAGLPIPGRMPNLKTYVTKKGNRGNRRGGCSGIGRGRGSGIHGKDITGKKMVGRGVSLNEISSMWTSFNPPITMNDDNDLSNDMEQDDAMDFYDDEAEQDFNDDNDDDDDDDDGSDNDSQGTLIANSDETFDNSQMSNSSSTNFSLPSTSFQNN